MGAGSGSGLGFAADSFFDVVLRLAMSSSFFGSPFVAAWTRSTVARLTLAFSAMTAAVLPTLASREAWVPATSRALASAWAFASAPDNSSAWRTMAARCSAVRFMCRR